MEVTRITGNNYEAFEALYPEDFVFREDTLAFGAVSEEKYAVACMVISAYDAKMVYIDWFYTDPAYRERGAGTELLDTVSSFLQNLSFERIMISFHDEDEGLEEFLSDRGFMVNTCDDMYELPLGDILYSERMDAFLENAEENESIGTIEDEEGERLLDELMEEQGIEKENYSDYSKKYSLLAANEEGKACGCILLSGAEDEDLEILFLHNEAGPGGLMGLIAALVRILREEEVYGRKLVFTDPNGQAANFLGDICEEEPENYLVKGFLQGMCVI